jgi:small subunit ribosomal protein S2
MMSVKEKKDSFGLKLNEMIEAGLHYGHKASRIHPKMKPYVATTRNNSHVIDLEKTIEKMITAITFIKETISSGKTLLVVGTKIQTRLTIRSFAEECGLPYINQRWLGGTFTNFKTIQKRIAYFKDLEKKKESGELEKYTKKERSLFDRELKNLEIKFGGIKNMDKFPDAIFVADIRKDITAIKEARRKGIKIVAVVDTNTDPSLVDYPIPANDETISSIKYILDRIKDAIIIK